MARKIFCGFGYVDAVINRDLTVIGDHQRIPVLKALGYDREK